MAKFIVVVNDDQGLDDWELADIIRDALQTNDVIVTKAPEGSVNGRKTFKPDRRQKDRRQNEKTAKRLKR